MTSHHDKPKRWRLRFSVWTMLLVMLFVAFSVSCCVRLHRDWYVPRTPLCWSDYSLRYVTQLRDSGRHVLILACSDATMTGSFEHMRAIIDTPELRRSVFQHGFVPVRASSRSHAELESLAQRNLIYPAVLVLSSDGYQVNVLQWPMTGGTLANSLDFALTE